MKNSNRGRSSSHTAHKNISLQRCKLLKTAKKRLPSHLTGMDASDAFEEVFHSPAARAQMKDMLVGKLAGYVPSEKKAGGGNVRVRVRMSINAFFFSIVKTRTIALHCAVPCA